MEKKRIEHYLEGALIFLVFYRGWDMYKSYNNEAWDVDGMSKIVSFEV